MRATLNAFGVALLAVEGAYSYTQKITNKKKKKHLLYETVEETVSEKMESNGRDWERKKIKK